MERLQQGGTFAVEGGPLAAIRSEFSAGSADEAETAAAIRGTLATAEYLADPHTAVGLAVSKRFLDPAVPTVTLATAHPAKFRAAVKAAAGFEPPLPEALGDITERPERFVTLANDRKAVEDHIAARTSAAAERV
jgi:threonine synthase